MDGGTSWLLEVESGDSFQDDIALQQEKDIFLACSNGSGEHLFCN